MFQIIFRTYPINTDGSPDDSRKEGELVAYSQGETRQEAEDNARTWLADLSEPVRTYTPEGKPRRKLGPVLADPNDTPPFTGKIRANAFVIFDTPR